LYILDILIIQHSILNLYVIWSFAEGILLLLTLVPSSVWSYCNYESKPLCGSSNQCGCVCDGGL